MTETTSKFRPLSGTTRGIERALLIRRTLVSATWATQIHHAPVSS